LDLDDYRREAEAFSEALSREHYLHLAGHKPTLDIEPIYAAHGALFEPGAVRSLRELAGREAPHEELRRRRLLLHFAVDGLIGEATKAEVAEAANLEAELMVEAGGETLPYRQVPVVQANESDGGRRAELEEARNRLVTERFDPLALATLERSHAICRELGWSSYAEAYAELRGIDLVALAVETESFLARTEHAYEEVVGSELRTTGLPQFGELRRSDLPRFFRATHLDPPFPSDRLVASLTKTLRGMGIDLEAQRNVTLDTEPRPSKSPRAFCSTPQVPGEVYLVVAPIGGRDDYAALFHEAGHTEHYANTEASLAFEFRLLGDNSVTESFAFLLEHLVDEPRWLRSMAAVDDPEVIVAHGKARRLLMLRRYAAKLAYELDLHAPAPRLEELPRRYASLLERATRARWPMASWLVDVDEGFYAACYLRAWALETYWRRALRERFGEDWFTSPAAGSWLREVWADGQRLDATELLAERLGEELRFDVLAEAYEEMV